MPSPAKRSSLRTRRPRDTSTSPTPSAPPSASTVAPSAAGATALTPIDESSPTRPAKRRKKVQHPSSEPADDEGSSLITLDQYSLSNLNDQDRLVSQVTPHLHTARTTASEIHSNTIHQENDEGVQAYAKIAGQDWTCYITTVRVNIGRTSDPTVQQDGDSSDPDYVHIDLGPGKVFSRETATIYYEAQSGKWRLQVKGRNGLKVDNVPIKKGDEPHTLSSGEVIEAGGIEMMFVLPGNTSVVHISSVYLERAGLKPQASSPVRETRTALPALPPSELSSSAPRPSSSRGSAFRQPIAPAPPDYKRPGTPPSAVTRTPGSHIKSPASVGGSSAMVMNQSDIDLSKDDNKHIKPHFSYAQMITQAIMSTDEHKLNLNGIYQYIMNNYSYYRFQPASGWQNSIRHNLSLNKSFNKAPRATDEPGKGMKWELVSETKDEMIKNAWKGGRGGHRGSSAPSSPSQPNQLNYITQGPKDMAAREPGSVRKRRVSPSAASPTPKSSFNSAHMTPDRKYLPPGPTSFRDGSPLPRNRKAQQPPTSLGPSDSTPRSPPPISSSFAPDENPTLATPAPNPINLRLAPPSTAQRPSQHMPTSSPAPFWKFADVVSSTPLRARDFDSPSKLAPPASSSPPRGADDRSPMTSPTKPGRAQPVHSSAELAEEEDEAGFDLTKGFQSISSYHAPPMGLDSLVQRASGTRAKP